MPQLDAGDPVTGFLACGAEYGSEFPRHWKKLLAKGGKSWTKLADEFGKKMGPAAQGTLNFFSRGSLSDEATPCTLYSSRYDDSSTRCHSRWRER
jgi:hypothetical protein